MSNELKNFLIPIVLVGVVSFFGGRLTVSETIVYETNYEQVYLDSVTVEQRSAVIVKQQLLDSINVLSDSFKSALKDKDKQIAGYARITADLNIKIDSISSESIELAALYELNNNNQVLKTPIVDTLLVSSAVFGESLIRSSAYLLLNGDSLILEPPELVQLRQIRIDVAVTVGKKNNVVHTLVTSEDFKALRVESFTEIKTTEPRLARWIVAVGAGLLAGVLLE